MGKKRRGNKNVVKKEDRTIQSKLAQWNTLDEVEGDSQDEFHEQRAKVLLHEEAAPAYYGSSGDEGVLDLSSASEEEEDEEEDDMEEFEREEALVKNITRNLPKKEGDDSDDQDDEMLDDGEEGWGTSARAYYDADQDSMDDEMAKEEEFEALRIQKKRLEGMEDDDFLDDTFALRLAATPSTKTKDAPRGESTLLDSEKLRLLKSRAPELENLLQEFEDKSGEVEVLKGALTDGDSEMSRYIRLKHQLLSVYLANISFYLHLRAQPVSEDIAIASISSVKSHPCLGVIVTLSEMIDKLEAICPNDLQDDSEASSEEEEAIEDIKTIADEEMASDVESDVSASEIEEIEPVKKSKKRKMGDKTEELMDISDIKSLLFASAASAHVAGKKQRSRVEHKVEALGQPVVGSEDEEEEPVKSKGRKSKNSKSEADRFSSSESEQEEAPREFNADELEALEYYESIKSTKVKQKLDRDALYAPLPVTLPDDEINEDEGDAAKRPANYQILSNKGLTPFRKKENRNPRVKRRNRYEKAMKKLPTFKKVAADRKTIGKYGGEMTGIKTHLARSTKL